MRGTSRNAPGTLVVLGMAISTVLLGAGLALVGVIVDPVELSPRMALRNALADASSWELVAATFQLDAVAEGLAALSDGEVDEELAQILLSTQLRFVSPTSATTQDSSEVAILGDGRELLVMRRAGGGMYVHVDVPTALDHLGLLEEVDLLELDAQVEEIAAAEGASYLWDLHTGTWVGVEDLDALTRSAADRAGVELQQETPDDLEIMREVLEEEGVWLSPLLDEDALVALGEQLARAARVELEAKDARAGTHRLRVSVPAADLRAAVARELEAAEAPESVRAESDEDLAALEEAGWDFTVHVTLAERKLAAVELDLLHLAAGLEALGELEAEEVPAELTRAVVRADLAESGSLLPPDDATLVDDEALLALEEHLEALRRGPAPLDAAAADALLEMRLLPEVPGFEPEQWLEGEVDGPLGPAALAALIAAPEHTAEEERLLLDFRVLGGRARTFGNEHQVLLVIAAAFETPGGATGWAASWRGVFTMNDAGTFSVLHDLPMGFSFTSDEEDDDGTVIREHFAMAVDGPLVFVVMMGDFSAQSSVEEATTVLRAQHRHPSTIAAATQ